jgi:hypothetical protein
MVTYEGLQILSPAAGCSVVEGGCTSACGKGPIVIRQRNNSENNGNSSSSSKTIFRRVVVSTGNIEQLSNVLDGPVDANRVAAVELVLEWEKLFRAGRYSAAIAKYEESTAHVGWLQSLQRLAPPADHRAKTSSELDASFSSASPAAVVAEWLVRVKCNQAVSYLEMNDVDGAISTAQDACDLSSPSCGGGERADCFRVLVMCFQRQGDVSSELDALQRMFSIADGEDESKLSVQSKNERRELGFRLAKLQRQVNDPH